MKPEHGTRRSLLVGAGLVLLIAVAWASFLLGRATARPAPVSGAATQAAPATLATATKLPTATEAPTATASPTARATRTPSPTGTATATASATNTTTSASPQEALELAMVDEINRLRREDGCAVALRLSEELTAAARAHSRDMAENHFFDHRGSDGSDRISRAQAAGFVGAPDTRVRENLGAGPDPAQVVAYWMDLGDIHRSQALDCAYNAVGVGYAMGDGDPFTDYWTANFGVSPPEGEG